MGNIAINGGNLRKIGDYEDWENAKIWKLLKNRNNTNRGKCSKMLRIQPGKFAKNMGLI